LFGFSVCVFLIALKLADWGIGWALKTEKRHWLRLTPNAEVTHKSNEFEYIYKTNSWGLRNPEIPLQKPEGTTRLAIVGDSFVAGLGVADDEVFPRLLEDRLSESSGPGTIQVLNLGRAGSSAIREADLYETVGRPFQPDAVVLAVFLGNDLVEILEEHNAEELKAWTPPGLLRGLVYRAYPNLYLELAMQKAARASEQTGEARSKEELWEFVRAAAQRKGLEPDPVRARFERMPQDVIDDTRKGLFSQSTFLLACVEPDRLVKGLSPDEDFLVSAWPRLKNQLERMKRLAEADETRFLIVLIPHAAQVDPAAWEFCERIGFQMRKDWLTEPSFLQNEIPAWCETHQVPCLDLTPKLREASDPVYYPKDGHWNPRGHELVAKWLSEWPELQTAVSENSNKQRPRTR
jgi:hypothetical protein